MIRAGHGVTICVKMAHTMHHCSGPHRLCRLVLWTIRMACERISATCRHTHCLHDHAGLSSLIVGEFVFRFVLLLCTTVGQCRQQVRCIWGIAVACLSCSLTPFIAHQAGSLAVKLKLTGRYCLKELCQYRSLQNQSKINQLKTMDCIPTPQPPEQKSKNTSPASQRPNVEVARVHRTAAGALIAQQTHACASASLLSS